MMSLEETSRALEEIAQEFGETAYMRSIRQEGRQEGREEGQERARVEALTAVLRERFGEQSDLSTVAVRLAAWPDVAPAMHAILTASTLNEVAAAAPPSA